MCLYSFVTVLKWLHCSCPDFKSPLIWHVTAVFSPPDQLYFSSIIKPHKFCWRVIIDNCLTRSRVCSQACGTDLPQAGRPASCWVITRWHGIAIQAACMCSLPPSQPLLCLSQSTAHKVRSSTKTQYRSVPISPARLN